jgi:hypothetical protein
MCAQSQKNQYILNLTRCCTQNCEICAVDALYAPSVSQCADLAHKEQNAGRELNIVQWCSIVDKLLAADPTIELDLSGGDCLALPWVCHRLIPYILDRVHDRGQVSVTSTADSLSIWLKELAGSSTEKRPGTVHITYDGNRSYSYTNLQLSHDIRELDIDVHAECPLTFENCTSKVVHEIYEAVREAEIQELLLMRFFPVGRGSNPNCGRSVEPSGDSYRQTLEEFLKLAEQDSGGPKIKIQCALRGFLSPSKGCVPCKMGNSTWCIMPNGTLLICPWAYGTDGNPLDSTFAAGNLLNESLNACQSKASVLRGDLRHRFPGKCRVRAFAAQAQLKANTLLSTAA